jgi:hypothetical protein
VEYEKLEAEVARLESAAANAQRKASFEFNGPYFSDDSKRIRIPRYSREI